MAIVVPVLRPEDLIDLSIEGHNLRLDTSDRARPVLVHEDPARDAILVAVFPPQAIAEQALAEADPPEPTEVAKAPGEYQARLSGATRLAFRVPAGTRIPFTIEGLLDWSALEPSLTPVGRVIGQPLYRSRRGPDVRQPTATQTAIELPYRLHISPGPESHWRHPLKPVSTSGRTVLWSTRLVHVPPGGAPLELGPERTTPIRAVYSPDYDPVAPPTLATPSEFLMSLGKYDRHALVRMTGTFTGGGSGRGRDVGKPAEARRLALTSLGGCLEAHGAWPDGPPSFSFASWTHQAALGRDSYVRTTYRGRLLPLMNRATMVRITERRFEPFNGQPVAYLRQYVRILVDESEVLYQGQPFVHDGREMPLAKVRINVDETPKIAIPGAPGSSAAFIPGTSSFEVKLGDAFWRFPCTATDRAGNPADLLIGMIFVPEDDIPSKLPIVASHYAAIPRARKTAAVNNARIKLADFGSTSETTAFVASGFDLEVDVGHGPAGFLPKMSGIDVRVPSLELLTGSPKSTSIRYTASFLQNGFDAAAGLFAEVADAAGLGTKFAADQAGGIVRPDLSVRGFSRDLGPIAGDLANVPAGTFDPATAFGSLDAKLFGALPIKDILGTNALGEASPKITTDVDPLSPGHVLTKLAWETRTRALNLGAVVFTPDAATRLKITAAIRKSIAAPGATLPASDTTVEGRLNAFSIELMDVVRINFDEFRFASGTGRATQVEVALAGANPFAFKGALDFVRKLSEMIPPGIFGASGPRITLKPDAIEVGFALPLPPAAFGVFSIRNIAISTALTLPFLTGRPSLAFALSSREKPFQVAVLILGGGGFVRVELDTEGVRGVEVMFEFGGMFALDVGVASGSVHILAGIYIGLKGVASELTGYVRVGGEVTVLAIVSISIEFMLSLSYYPGPKVAKGVASLTLSARIAFITISVSVSVERSFGSGSRHLSIGEAMSAADWARYAGAFG